MREGVRVKEKEPAPPPPMTDYDHLVKTANDFVKRQYSGKVVIRARDREMQATRQGSLRYYLNVNHDDTCLPDWLIKTQEIPVRSGKHKHQGSVIIFVLEGEGTTVIDDVSYDWREGDLVVVPLKPGGVVHQHINRTPGGKPARWLALSNMILYQHVGAGSEQIENAPSWKGA